MISIKTEQFYKTRTEFELKKTKRFFTIYKVFSKQSLAYEWMKSHLSIGTNVQGDLRIFSFQFDKEDEGKRKYLVTTLETFWDEYLPMDRKHFYELIEEEIPCHLYFDLEYDRGLNGDKNGNELVQQFSQFVTDRLQSEFEVKVEEIIVLDATTDLKFSNHLIFRMDGYKFRNNRSAGQFVSKILLELELALYSPENGKDGRAEDMSESPMDGCSVSVPEDAEENDNNTSTNGSEKDIKRELANLITIRTSNGNDFFVDRGVYSRNRNFRLWLSTKLNKNNPLRLINEHEISFSWFRKTLVCDGLPSEILPDIGNSNSKLAVQSLKKPIKAQVNFIQGSSGRNDIEQKLLNEIQKVSHQNAYIRSFLETQSQIVYQIGGNRYCHNIQREHKSNGVYYLVDLGTQTYHQRCHDPDCKGFRSETRYLNPDYFEEVDDSAIANLADEYEYFDGILDQEFLSIE